MLDKKHFVMGKKECLVIFSIKRIKKDRQKYNFLTKYYNNEIHFMLLSCVYSTSCILSLLFIRTMCVKIRVA